MAGVSACTQFLAISWGHTRPAVDPPPPLIMSVTSCPPWAPPGQHYLGRGTLLHVCRDGFDAAVYARHRVDAVSLRLVRRRVVDVGVGTARTALTNSLGDGALVAGEALAVADGDEDLHILARRRRSLLTADKWREGGEEAHEGSGGGRQRTHDGKIRSRMPGVQVSTRARRPPFSSFVR